MKENEFLGWILGVAAAYGWRAWHVPAPMRPIPGGRMVPEKRAAGLPDLVLLHARPPRLIFAEVKKSGGELSAEQQEFLGLARAVADTVRECGYGQPPIRAFAWWPGNETLIEAVLAGKHDPA